MLHLIKTEYKNPEEKDINFPIINREYEKSLNEYIVDCFKSISLVLPEIQMESHSFIIDVQKVNQSDYERTRSNKTKDINQKFSYIKDSRLGELRMVFKVHMNYEGEEEDLTYNVKMLIPIPDKNGYYLIKGKRYMLQYQLTESATYTTPSGIVTKSLMPIKMRKKKNSYFDIQNKEYIFNYVQITMFEKYEMFLYFFFATMGWSNALEYLDVGKYIKAVREPEYYSDYTYFRVSNNLYIKVKTAHLESDYIQNMIGSILEVMSNRIDYDDLENKDMWIAKIGAFKLNAAKESHYELGKRYLILFNRMLDEATKYSLRLTEYNKLDIYAIVRWMLQNYKELWSKNNLDIVNKRLRCNEYVASLLNQIISDKIKKFVNTTVNTKEKMITKYRNFFSYRGNEIISKLHSSGLMRYDDIVSDMDLFQKLKITQKGPNASGSKSDAKTISSERRSLHPSHIGRQDINVCSASDPGLTNYITPLCKTDGLYFKDAPPEPESFYVNFKKSLGDWDENGDEILIIDPVKYNNVLQVVSGCSIIGIEDINKEQSSDTNPDWNNEILYEEVVEQPEDDSNDLFHEEDMDEDEDDDGGEMDDLVPIEE